MELDDAQREVVESPGDRRLLVVAGAGQGKTEVVAARIGYLVEEEYLSASTEILVLSFSRAAVTAVRTRLDLREVAAANLRTFDSFASQILIGAGVEPAGTFEARIRQATKTLEEAKETPFEVEDLRHVVIDEVQDLVGDRADFVLAILRRLDPDAGLTVLGDPLQGIYDFQLAESQSKTSSSDVFAALMDEFGTATLNLGRNYRARGKYPKKVVELGDRLRVLTDAQGAQRVIDEFVEDLPLFEDIEEWTGMLPAKGVRTAVLCATNGEVLRVSKYLNDNGIAHAVRRRAQDFGAARWIAQALGPLNGPDIRRSDAEEALERVLGEQGGEEAWYLLKSAENSRRSTDDALNISRIRNLVTSRTVPLTLTEPDMSNLIVSTVHRAKGLEFDRVFIVDRSYERDDEDAWASARAQYVALSRAREKIFLCELPRTYAVYREMHWLPGRILERVRNWKSKTNRTRAVEFQYTDVAVDHPVYFEGFDAVAVQETLAADDLVGARVSARLDKKRATSELPSYLLTTEDGRSVGRTSDSFNEAFVKAFGRRAGSWPAILSGMSLVSVESVGGDPRKSRAAGVGSCGLWLAPRIVGLAQPDWSTREEIS
ncbi:UvrD-helicase domain-containing protein [Nocardia aobensis]|uniref:UvrD-helicase domain-containing protein n=1 Tax=Nocardia aobensis TaxID=257277 RepID=A0ABW6NY36_9NOCA